MNAFGKAFIASAIALSALSACTDAHIASQNLATAADKFELQRRIVFVNGITDTYLLSIEGFCSIEVQSGERQLEVVCKKSPTEYVKHHLGLSDNVTYFSEQIETANVNVYNYRVIFKPEAIIPHIELNTSQSKG